MFFLLSVSLYVCRFHEFFCSRVEKIIYTPTSRRSAAAALSRRAKRRKSSSPAACEQCCQQLLLEYLPILEGKVSKQLVLLLTYKKNGAPSKRGVGASTQYGGGLLARLARTSWY